MVHRYNARHAMARAIKALPVRARIGIAAGTIAGLSVAGLTLATTASAGAVHVKFAASHDGASAGWSNGPGSPIDLTLGSESATTFATVTLKRLPATAVSALQEPQFSTNNYQSGSPRFFITLSNGQTLWGYPPNSGLNGGLDFAWAINNGNTYQSWSAIQAAESSATVTGASVIADGDQAPGVTDVITGLQFGGVYYN
jgi:hypothetical protein